MFTKSLSYIQNVKFENVKFENVICRIYQHDKKIEVKYVKTLFC